MDISVFKAKLQVLSPLALRISGTGFHSWLRTRLILFVFTIDEILISRQWKSVQFGW